MTDWSLPDDDFDSAMGPATSRDMDNGTADVQLDDAAPAEMVPGKAYEETHGTKSESTRDRQVKPNKIYIGGLPEHTRPEDLRNCFGKIGNIITIELKLGYGFVEFDSREAAEESVARYNEGYFMGNKIRVEPSHSRGRQYKRPEDPGACFKCGETGHWARECPNPGTQSRGGPAYESSSHDRGYSGRDYNHHHQSRDSHSYRDDYSRQASSREDRYYDSTPAAAPPSRDQRKAMTPPRDRRDNTNSRRDYGDDYRMRSPPPPQPVSRYERSGQHNSEREYTSTRTQPHRDQYDRYERRAAYTEDRNASYSSHGGRARTPPGPPPPAREEYEKPSRGNYQSYETRRRAATPPPPYPGSSANGTRSRRRSLSPPPRYDTRYSGQGQSEGERYGAPRDGARVRDYHRSSRAEDNYGHRRS